MKKYVINYGHQYFEVPSKEAAIEMLGMKRLNRDYIDGKYLYFPAKGDDEVTLILVDEFDLREVTKEEKENKELKQANNSLKYYKDGYEKMVEEIKGLKCLCLLYTSDAADE